MKISTDSIMLSKRHRVLWQIIYWIFASLTLLFVFSNSQYDFAIRVAVSIAISATSFGVSSFINYILIPKYLFGGKLFKFFYLLLFSVLFSVWINLLSLIFILWYTSSYFPGSSLPNTTDLMLLISGSFLIITFAAIIHFIKETYSKIIERNRAEQQKTETELKLQEAKLKLLQGQLHPHFLFNMLNNLYGLWIENSKSTPDVILKLSSLLDYMLYECDKDKVPLKNELQFINNYVELEKIRHDERLKVEVHIPENLDNHTISPLILFCFVENAFKHGANKTSGDSSIAINLKIKNELLEFDVQNSFVKNSESKTSNGVGLKNLKERLNLIYPESHKLELVSSNGIYSAILTLKLN